MTSRGSLPALARALRGSQGVTLLEMVIALSLLMLALGAIYGLIAVGGRSARVTNEFVQTQAQVRAALDSVVDELRWGQAVTCASATSLTVLIPQDTPFSAASPYRVTFAYDVAADTLTRRQDAAGVVCPPAGVGEPLAYFIVGPDGGDGIAFEYFDAAGRSLGASPADPGAVARVRITVTTTRDRVSRTFAGDTALRAR